MPLDRQHSVPTSLTRRDVLKAGGLALGALSVARPALAQIMILENVPHLWLDSADTIDFTQTSVKGFRQHPTTMLYGFEGAWLDKA